MFKKLKKKIEDGDVASPDRNPFGFSPHSTRMAVPGVPVRLPSETEPPRETEGNDNSAQQFEEKTTERRVDENAQVPLNDNGCVTGVVSVADYIPKTGVPPTWSADVDPSVARTSVDKTPVKASTGWQGLTSMIRGDSSAQQHLLELERQKEKLEAALERQQDLMVQRLKEQYDLHQREIEAEREKAITQVKTSKEKELMEAKDLISNLESSVSKLKLELAESNHAQGALRQQYTELSAVHSLMEKALHEREEECRQLQIQYSALREQVSRDATKDKENQRSEFEEEGVLTVDNGMVAPTPEAKEISTPRAVLEGSPPAAILEVKQRDIQWTHQDSTAASVNGVDHQQNSAEVTQMCDVLDANRRMQEELMEKDQAIKVLQQKMADLKKTLQKELMQKSQSTGPAHWESPHNPPNRSVSIPAPPSHQQQEADVSYQYLKHVVLRYMCSEGEEARYLVKAISTLLNFSKTEERRIKEYMDYKVSWFGTRPPPVVPSSNRRNAFSRT